MKGKVGHRKKQFIIPEYSLTGDLLAYLNCELQYRYSNRANLPPSRPVQLWFGEFIHGVMEEAYKEYHENPTAFPWDWKDKIRPIEMNVYKRLVTRGLNAVPNLFCRYEEGDDRQGACQDTNHPHKLIASHRADLSINVWGKELFPLISEAEFKLKGLRDMPDDANYRSLYYGVTGVIDVLGSFNFKKISENKILDYVFSHPEVSKVIESLDEEYEIIVDYKGTRRPSTASNDWKYHEWQVLTYAHLRREQEENSKPIAAILLYLNELYPSKEGLKPLKKEIEEGTTDIIPDSDDLVKIKGWDGRGHKPELSQACKEKRSIRIVAITDEKIKDSLEAFDDVVKNIESCILHEIDGQQITESWSVSSLTEEKVERTCVACDFKTNCPFANKIRMFSPTVP